MIHLFTSLDCFSFVFDKKVLHSPSPISVIDESLLWVRDLSNLLWTEKLQLLFFGSGYLISKLWLDYKTALRLVCNLYFIQAILVA